MPKNKPWQMFFGMDWLTDPHLRCCKRQHRSDLVDLMCLAQNGNPRGYLNNGGQPLGEREICKLLGISPTKWRKSRKELLENNRLGFDGKMKTLFIPRMVRDGQRHKKAVENGSKGGNPSLIGRRSQVLIFTDYIESIWDAIKAKNKKTEKKLIDNARKAMAVKHFNEMEEVLAEWKKDGRGKK